jgi:hypothetical protein
MLKYRQCHKWPSLIFMVDTMGSGSYSQRTDGVKVLCRNLIKRACEFKTDK